LGHNIFGTTERVRSFTTDDALRFTKRLYTPSNAVFFMYGGKRMPTIPLDSDIHAEPRMQKTPVSSALTFNAYSDTVRDKGTHQAHMMIGCPSFGAGDGQMRERMSLYLLNNIIGGRGMNSRLNVVLREHRGLVYTVESSMTTYGDTGLWCAYLGCDKDDIKRCLRLVRRELDKFMKEPISQRRLNAAKKQLRGQLTIDCDNRENFALDLGSVYLFRNKVRDVEKTCMEIDAVTADDIQRVAYSIFEPSKMTTLIYK
jgi:predicted Zn-dependent peptidase